MVAIPNKIFFTNFNEFYWRQRYFLIISLVNPDPAVFGVRLPRKESSVEVVVSPLAAYNFVE
jgi:hypothetical protein